MNKVQSLLGTIHKLLFEDQAPAPETVETTTIKLKDGTDLQVTKLEVGGVATVSGVAAIAGSYPLEDGSTLTIGEGGAITEILPAAAPAEVDMTKPENMRKLYDKFATGAPDERIANLETITRAVMEYCFGWQLREAQDKATKDAAIKVYTDSLKVAETKLQAHEKANKLMFEALQELAGMPSGELPETKKSFSFSTTDSKKKGLQKFIDAAKHMN